ncbi:hypothetical protein CEXT_144931 [Caerostris extrusa]|uniref:Uncharacterized protein n=1 Tax=Caerostris extrusa TaxID=172846 RepID=A0AAV4Q578_CAEEX|nr:hypothetical protein CEXT_144931 [Caerostris extrusa]
MRVSIGWKKAGQGCEGDRIPALNNRLPRQLRLSMARIRDLQHRSKHGLQLETSALFTILGEVLLHGDLFHKTLHLIMQGASSQLLFIRKEKKRN